jgi:pyrroloquinoline quinone biosynthesis protein D
MTTSQAGSDGGSTASAETAPMPASPPWTRDSLPRLPSKVRLQWDDARNQAMLLFPEGVLVLNPTANAVLELVDGTRTVGDIVVALADKFTASDVSGTQAEEVNLSTDPGTESGDHHALADAGPASVAADRKARIERDVTTFLQSLEARGWLERGPAAP